MEESLYSRRVFAVVRSWSQSGIVEKRAGPLSRSMRGKKIVKNGQLQAMSELNLNQQ